ncbi:phosphatase inhibitor-domain-containing protein [Mycotypha africana]|uniref:phosphatase inhibitor-domain-containing protein n=1 Tax=Mycotypha africana TaxID=64632 RepID=UPI002301DF61|nr:phosphatase inhibitor-domain-containing protein [Mycotypha africana]KAI8984133.1 phosphatase inhibitor-domain-containing protein [Mycotypha africana]
MSSIHPQTYTRMRSETPVSSHGSRTLTVEDEDEEFFDKTDSNGASEEDDQEPFGVLHLRGDMNARRRLIHWDESVVDNEHMNKKKSKICCIYHKPRAVGESSDESSSSSSNDGSDSDDSDDSVNNESEKIAHQRHSRTCKHSHSKRRSKRNPREVSPNAYERQPNYNK